MEQISQNDRHSYARRQAYQEQSSEEMPLNLNTHNMQQTNQSPYNDKEHDQVPFQKSDSHELEIQLSPAEGNEGNYGSTMFEDRHRQSFEESHLESPNPTTNKEPSPQENQEIESAEVLIDEKQLQSNPIA